MAAGLTVWNFYFRLYPGAVKKAQVLDFLQALVRHLRLPLLVVWDQRDSFTGEDDPPVPFEWSWPATRAAAVDAFGQAQPAQVLDGQVRLHVSVTPLLVTAG